VRRYDTTQMFERLEHTLAGIAGNDDDIDVGRDPDRL
jgi:hypothetical protein